MGFNACSIILQLENIGYPVRIRSDKGKEVVFLIWIADQNSKLITVDKESNDNIVH